MATTFSNLLYHIVYSTKDRIPLIDGDLREPLYEYIGGIIRGERGILLEIGGVPDHVHLLAKFKTDIAVSMMVQKIKGNSSGWVNERPGPMPRFEWQAGYGIFSVSLSLGDKVRRYIRNQEKPHKKVSFKAELTSTFEKNSVLPD